MSSYMLLTMLLLVGYWAAVTAQAEIARCEDRRSRTHEPTSKLQLVVSSDQRSPEKD